MTDYIELTSLANSNITHVETLFVVPIYKDMELADEIEYSDSFENFSEALKHYNKEAGKSGSNYYITLGTEINYYSDNNLLLTEVQEVRNNYYCLTYK